MSVSLKWKGTLTGGLRALSSLEAHKGMRGHWLEPVLVPEPSGTVEDTCRGGLGAQRKWRQGLRLLDPRAT